MYDYLLGVISCICMFHAGLCDEDCNQTILARRQSMYVPAGGALSLSCVVRHCGLHWTGTWLWQNSTDGQFSTVENTERHHFINVTLSAVEAQLTLKILSIKQADEGSYKCSVTWGNGNIDQGHLMSMNVTAAALSRRDFSHRVFIWAGAFLCLPIILGLARWMSSKTKPPTAEFIYTAVYRNVPHPAPQPLPRQPVLLEKPYSSHEVPPRTHQATEVVYADVSQDALQRQGTFREPAQSTVYSLLKFP
ncbi:unnamed protein product [Ophioblennius macclurei]